MATKCLCDGAGFYWHHDYLAACPAIDEHLAAGEAAPEGHEDRMRESTLAEVSRLAAGPRGFRPGDLPEPNHSGVGLGILIVGSALGWVLVIATIRGLLRWLGVL